MPSLQNCNMATSDKGYETKVSCRLPEELYDAFNALLRQCVRAGLKFRTRGDRSQKLGIEGLLSALLLDFFDHPESEHLVRVARCLRRVEAMRLAETQRTQTLTPTASEPGVLPIAPREDSAVRSGKRRSASPPPRKPKRAGSRPADRVPRGQPPDFQAIPGGPGQPSHPLVSGRIVTQHEERVRRTNKTRKATKAAARDQRRNHKDEDGDTTVGTPGSRGPQPKGGTGRASAEER
jgi:hypothetical protein